MALSEHLQGVMSGSGSRPFIEKGKAKWETGNNTPDEERVKIEFMPRSGLHSKTNTLILPRN